MSNDNLVCGCGIAPDGAPGAHGCSPSCMTPEPQFTPDNPMYPDVTVQLVGTEGNAFAIIGAVSKALRQQIGRDAADRFANEAMEQDSYDELLTFVQSTVRVS